ncbi:RHS repeat-associated core domain-containing protein, partial [Streptantibioticus ferralitis]|uniref:RHS repeat-associated core domain-containing protein n=1 Tax=Streptantibioticus ferralitis TaxID=236510 RepID=UPI003555C3DF
MPGGGTAVRTGSSTFQFEVTDPHGSSGLFLDSTAQTPTWRQFTPYGAPRGTATTWIDNRGFLNAPNDSSTKLTIIGARQYDPTTGRFISLDPLLEATSPQELNGYTYAANNPVTLSDPTGLRPIGPGDNPQEDQEWAQQNHILNYEVPPCSWTAGFYAAGVKSCRSLARVSSGVMYPYSRCLRRRAR